MKKLFNQVPIQRRKLNKFDLSEEKKMSLNMGDLVPIMLKEVVPGDKFRVESQIFMRLAPMLAPMMHRVNVYTHYFFVPNRLVHDDWEDFITGGESGAGTAKIPRILLDDDGVRTWMQKGSLSDYFGIPPMSPTQITAAGHLLNAIPFRGYQRIYEEYYRDQNLEDDLQLSTDSSDISNIVVLERYLQLRKRAWEKDYFTSALPWAQRGGEVNLPMDIEFTPQYKDPATVSNNPTSDAALYIDSSNDTIRAQGGVYLTVENLEDPQIVDSSNVTINELRNAFRLQEWLEKNARGGSRYIEQILSHFGVKSSDARLQRPEYLGGGKQPITISEIVNNTDANVNNNPIGSLAGHGISVGNSNRFSRGFEEHGFIFGIMSVLPKTAYQQGLERHWQKFDKFDYFWPEFAHLGEQPIKSSELYMAYQDHPDLNEETFGYQSRYAEYKHSNSQVHGDFRDELAHWHMGRIFDSRPNLNETFIHSDPTHRVFAVTDPTEHKLYCQIYNKIDALRLMPYFGTPQF